MVSTISFAESGRETLTPKQKRGGGYTTLPSERRGRKGGEGKETRAVTKEKQDNRG